MGTGEIIFTANGPVFRSGNEDGGKKPCASGECVKLLSSDIVAAAIEGAMTTPDVDTPPAAEAA